MFLKFPLLSIGRAGQWVLESDLVYRSAALKCEITVLAGFETDLASIPPMFRSIIPVNGQHRLAAIVHDDIYSKKGKMSFGVLTRAQADRIFLEAMKELGVGFFTRQLMYAAVRAGGWSHWH